jgi:gliding motility-associated-like protein
MKHITLPRTLILFLLILSVKSYSQTPLGCDTNAVRAAFAAAGHYTELIVDNEACSMYFINTTSEDAAQAETDAETLGAHLAVMKDATEDANVTAAINAGGWLSGGAVIWLGYHRTGTGDSYPFTPLDGTPLGYTNWNPGEPNDEGWGGGINSPSCYTSFTGCTFCSNSYLCNNGEQCVEIYASGTWNDLACNSNSISLVKVNLCPVISGIDDTLLCTVGATLNLTPTTLLGSVPYTYSWAPGGQSTASVTVNPAATTTYSVTATDRYSCYSTTAITATVVNLTTPVVSASSAAVCTGVNTFINFTNTYPAGTVYNWTYDGGVNASGNAPDSISWTTSGTKNVTLYVTDQGCTSGTGTLPVTVNAIPVADAGPAVQVCSGAQVSLGSATVAGVTYSWSPALGLSSAAVSDPVLSAVNPGTTTLSYPFVVTATSNNCSSTSTAVVTLYPPISNTFTVTPATVCAGQDAVIAYSGTNSAAATYTWGFGAGADVVSGTAQGPYTVNWPAAGSPSVSLSVSENNCTITPVSTVVTVNAIPVADAGPAVQFCSGSSANLGVAPVAGVTYSWSPTVGLSSATVSNPVIGGVNPTSANIVQTYTVIATENGCSDTASAVVTMYEPIVTTFSISPDSACINQNVTITYTGTNDASAIYNWGFGGGTATGTGQGPYSVNWATAGSPNVTLNVTENGCTGVATTVPASIGNPPAANPGAAQTVCSGGTVQLGTAAVGTVAYTWSPASNLSSAAIAQPSFSYSNTATTAQTFVYGLLADDNGCTASASVNVTVSPPAVVPVVASGPLEFCDGGSVTLSFSGAYTTYQWTNAATTPEITVTAAGSYGAALVDANGCEYVSDPLAVVIVDANPTVNLVQKTDEQCYGEADASITVAGAGGHQPYGYSWSTSPAQTTAAISNILPGPYTITVTDQKNCTVTGQYVIDTAAYFGIPIDSGHNVSCYGFSDGEVFTTAKGGTPAYTYLWNNGAGTAVIENLVAGTYAVTVTDSHGCTVTDSTIVTQPDSFSVTIGDSLNMNFGSQLTLSLNVAPSGSYTYVWNPANSLTCSDCPNPSSLASATTIYSVTVTNAIGCSNTLTFTLNVNGDKHLFIPNAFTPGGNANSTFNVYTIGAAYYHIEIFDRWGEKVYDGNDLENGWDGQFKGKPSMQGIYTYEMTIVYQDGQNLKRAGTLTLLR